MPIVPINAVFIVLGSQSDFLYAKITPKTLEKRENTINRLEKMLAKPIPQEELTDDEHTLHRYTKILDINTKNII